MSGPVDARGCEEPIWGFPCVALDFETTWDPWDDGSRPESHRPVEAGAVLFRIGGPVEAEWSSRIFSPTVNPEATAVHGLRAEDLRAAPEEAEALRGLLPLLEGRLLVAYSLPFDHGVLSAALARAGLRAPPLSGICPMALSAEVWRYKRGKTLRDALRRLGFPAAGLHGALADARACASVTEPLLRAVAELGAELRTARDAWEVSLACGIAWERALGRSLRGRITRPWSEASGVAP